MDDCWILLTSYLAKLLQGIRKVNEELTTQPKVLGPTHQNLLYHSAKKKRAILAQLVPNYRAWGGDGSLPEHLQIGLLHLAANHLVDMCLP